jgi:hypothetical protein
MSDLLKEAIVDAKALREAALKSAETTIIDKYSVEVRNTLNSLLEQDELDLGGDLGGEEGGGLGDLGLGAETEASPAAPLGAGEDELSPEETEIVEDIPLAATDGLSGASGTGLRGLPKSGEPVEFNVDLDALQEAITELETELDENEQFELDMQDIAAILNEDDQEGAEDLYDVDEDSESDDDDSEGSSSAGALAASAAATKSEDEAQRGAFQEGVYSEEMIEAIVEKLTVDMGDSLSGWAGRSQYDMKWEMEKEMAHRRSTDIQKDLEILKKAQEELVFENKQLKEQNTQYKQATIQLKEGLQDVNLSNARLLYTNRVLRNTSLNERQKEKIVEAISRAGSVMEARTIFDTLQSTVQSTPKRGPQSLSEAINRRSSSSIIRASRHEEPSSDPFQDRMKRLAGIK